jgi:hypothetical protein
MLEILLYNMIFWSVWIWICMLPEKIVQYVIENNENFFEKK